MRRLDRASVAVANAMRILPVAGEPGYPAPGEIAAGLALILRARCGPMERLTLASAAILALDRDAAEELAEVALGDLRAGHPIPPFMSIRVSAQSWAAFASLGEMREYLAAIWNRLPELEQARFLSAARLKRGGAQISCDDTPRAILAAAWVAAPDRDRRDLVNRATGRVSA